MSNCELRALLFFPLDNMDPIPEINGERGHIFAHILCHMLEGTLVAERECGAVKLG